MIINDMKTGWREDGKGREQTREEKLENWETMKIVMWIEWKWRDAEQVGGLEPKVLDAVA